jgi:hypothetical protein
MRKISYTQIYENQLPKDINNYLERSDDVEGARLIKSGDGEYVKITLGMRPTGGYSVEILDMYQDRDTLNICVRERTPREDACVIQAFTSPKAFAKINERVECGEIKLIKTR